LEEEEKSSLADRKREGITESSRYFVSRRPSTVARTYYFHNRKLSSKSLREIGVVK